MIESQILVDERVNINHPEIENENAVHAFKSMIRHKHRSTGEFVGVGVDDKSRLLEIVYKYNVFYDFFYIYHSQKATPKVLKEVGLI